MKLKKGFTLTNIVDDYMVIPVGENASQFNGTVMLNELSYFILNEMKEDITEEVLLKKVLNAYDVSAETAKKDLEEVLQIALKIGLIEK